MPWTCRRPRRRAATAAVLALTLVCGATVVLSAGAGVRAAVPPVPGEIAFARMAPAPPGPTASPTSPTLPRPARTQLDLARVVAAAPFPAAGSFGDLLTPAADETYPAWSRDGRRIAFARTVPGSDQSAIWVAAADGSAARQLTFPPAGEEGESDDWDDVQPSWSPDGARLVFTRTLESSEGEDVPSGLWTVPTLGAVVEPTPLVNNTAIRPSQPDWSPVADVIAYRHEVEGEGENPDNAWIATIPAAGGAGTPLTNAVDGADDHEPAWSPDGTRLAFIAQWWDRPTLTVRTIATGAQSVLVAPTIGSEGELGSFAGDPAWSPDGQLIAYSWMGISELVSDLRAVPAAGGDPIEVAAGPTAERQPSWRPTADLHVTLSATPVPMRYGEAATVVATVSNGGPAPARAATLQLSVSPGFNPVSVQPAGCLLSPGGQVTCQLGTLAAGASVTVTVSGRPLTVDSLVADALVDSAVVDLDPADNRTRLFIDVEGTDLAVTAVDTGTPYLIGGTVTYDVSVDLVVGDPVQAAVLEFTLPDNVTFAGVDGPAGLVCPPPDAAVLRCTLPALGFEGPTTVEFVVRATAVELGERQGAVRVVAPIPDINPANDTTTVTTRVVPPGLAIAKQAPTTAVVGTEFAYDLGVRNGGERPVAGAVLVDVVPPGLEVVAVESDTATCSTADTPPPAPPAPPVTPSVTVTCLLPVLAAAGVETPAGTAQVRIRVRPTAPGQVTNTACVRVTLGEEPTPSPSPSASVSPSPSASVSPSPSVSPSEPLPEPIVAALPRLFEDCDSATTTVHAGDLAVEVTATPPDLLVGAAINATVTVRNVGTAAVPGAVQLSLPAIACEAPVAGACAAVTRDIALGPLDPGTSVAVPLSLVAVAAGTATITARVLPATFDATAANDQATASVLVRQPPEVPIPPVPPAPIPPVPPPPPRQPILTPVPAIGPPGFVTSVRGSDFPPGAVVRLSWSRGLTLNSPPVTVRADGTFVAPLLIAQRDGLLGPRLVVATMEGLPQVRSPRFLVVPGTLDPPDFVVRR